MALELQWRIRGKTLKSKWWYGRLDVGDRPSFRNLGIAVRGQPPQTGSLKDKGDDAFESSRNEALRALENWREELRKNHGREQLLQQIHEVRFGTRVQSVPLWDDGDRLGLVSNWIRLPRRAPLAPRNQRQEVDKLNRFLAFVKERYPTATEMVHVRSGMAEDYMAHIRGTGVSPKTYNNTLVSLRGAFARLADRAGLSQNPFVGIPKETVVSVRREVFSEAEIARIVAAAKREVFIGPIVITALTTAMRRGDCCCLKWSDVNLEAGMIRVIAAKTKHSGSKALEIPILPLLREVLSTLVADAQRSQWVFPKQRAMYVANPDGVTYRFARFMETLGYGGTEGDSEVTEATTLRKRGERSLRAVSTRGLHSFRATWATMALNSGVPESIVRSVTGHATLNTVLKHYYSPQTDTAKTTISVKLPSVLQTGEAKKPVGVRDELLGLVSKLTEQQAARALKLMKSKFVVSA